MKETVRDAAFELLLGGVGKVFGLFARGGKTALAAKKADDTYEIVDGVRRAKAAQLVGKTSIKAEVRVAGKTTKRIDIPLEKLRSPNKTAIDVSSSQANMNRWQSVVEGTKAGEITQPIVVSPGSRGLSIVDVLFK